jgi:hypothetical protein
MVLTMTGPDETANLVGEITRAYREHADDEARITAVPGQVLGSDIEGQADELADDAARLAALLASFTNEPRRSMDVIAVFRRLSETAASMEAAAAELCRQEWFDLNGEDPEASAAWSGALEGCGPLRAPSSGSLTAGSDRWRSRSPTGSSGPRPHPGPPWRPGHPNHQRKDRTDGLDRSG